VRVTSQTQYAIRALFDLAFHSRGQAAQAKEIAERQRIPQRYLEQILQDLRKAGIVEARRGPRGGYALARPPEAVSLADVFRAVRGPLEQMFALDGSGEPKRRRARAAGAATGVDVPALVWGDVTTRLIGVLEGVTLQDLVARAESSGVERAVKPPTMYFI
jgi:Rrf2 family transcriptional regulator, iron-sulfur cluster assembly transcription factor